MVAYPQARRNSLAEFSYRPPRKVRSIRWPQSKIYNRGGGLCRQQDGFSPAWWWCCWCGPWWSTTAWCNCATALPMRSPRSTCSSSGATTWFPTWSRWRAATWRTRRPRSRPW